MSVEERTREGREREEIESSFFEHFILYVEIHLREARGNELEENRTEQQRRKQNKIFCYKFYHINFIQNTVELELTKEEVSS